MATTKFTDATASLPGTLIQSSWLNDVDTATYAYLTNVAGTNTLTANAPAGMTAYIAGQRFYLNPVVNSSGPVTLNIGGLGAKAITKYGTFTPLVSLDLIVGSPAELVYDGTQFQLLNPASTLNPVTVVPIVQGGTGAITASQALINLGATGRLLNVQRFTASGTYTPTTGTTSVIVEAVGGGGAGGGAGATGASQISAGSGGGTGGRTVGKFTAPGSQVVTIGAGGTGVVAGNGNTGGTTSFGALLTALGGIGGTFAAAGTQVVASGGVGASASSTGGNILATTGNNAPLFLNTFQGFPYGQNGANSFYGQGGLHAGFSLAGNPAPVASYGAGGGGGSNQTSSASTFAGGAGAPGILIVYEYS